MNATTPAYRIDGELVDERRFYAVACDPARSVVVEACAGAGKTWMLVSRIVRALLAGVQPREILAITFTRKAAGEMRSRLDEWLHAYAAVRGGPAQRVAALVARGLGRAEAQAAEPLLAQLAMRLREGDRAIEIRTFHGWFAQLLAGAPQQLVAALGLPAPWTLIEDTSPLADELFRRFHRRVDADPALARDYVELVEAHRRSTVQLWLESAWDHRSEIVAADAAGTLEGAVLPAAALFPECAGIGDPRALMQRPPCRDALARLADDYATGKGPKRAAAVAALQAALAIDDPAEAFETAWRPLFTADDVPIKVPTSPYLEPAQRALEPLRAMSNQHLAHLDHGRLVRLARALLAEYRKLQHERGLVDMVDLEHAALALLADPAAAGWVQQRLDVRVRQILVDEFQDTSPLQWHALFGWLSAYAGAGAGAAPAVFIVGDPKQSIYRFRRAEPRVFAAAREFVVDGLGGHALASDHTRRNAPEVLDAVNRVFADAAAADGWGPFRDHSTACREPGAVLRLPGVPRSRLLEREKALADVWRDTLTQPKREVEQRLRADEARHVAATIGAWLAEGRVGAGAVMVLARQRARLADVAEALAARGISYVMPEALPLAEAPEALDVVAVLDVLASPGHDLSLARALKSPLFGAGDDDLLWLSAAARGAGRSWLRTLLDAGAGAPPALQRARTLLRGWNDAAALATPHALLDRIVAETDYELRLAATVPPPRRHVARHAVRALLAAALEFDDARHASLYRFVRAVRAGHLAAQAAVPPEAVQLLTVHGAKGLEADAVFVIDALPEVRPADRGTVLVDWPPERTAPRAVAFVRTLTRAAPSLQALRDHELREREREELNVLYVAMTRARRWLVFSHTEPWRPDDGRSWWERVEPIALPYEPPVAAAAAAAASAEVDVLPALQLPLDFATPPAAAADPRAVALGRAVHRLLEWIGRRDAPLPRAEWPAAAREAAVAFGLDAGAAAEVAKIAATVAASPHCARFYDPAALLWAGNEVPVALAGRALRIDRVVQLRGDGAPEWWVLDYKLNRSPEQLESYRAQLDEYRRGLLAAGVEGPVRAAFVTGAGQLVEI